MKTYTQTRDFLRARLISMFGYDPTKLPEFVQGVPGSEPASDTIDDTVTLTAFPGPGLILEQTYDRVGWGVDVAGKQGDYDSCETLADQIDKAFLSVHTPEDVGGVRTLTVQRAGGRPTIIAVDNADRWHAGCSYVAQVQSGVR